MNLLGFSASHPTDQTDRTKNFDGKAVDDRPPAVSPTDPASDQTDLAADKDGLAELERAVAAARRGHIFLGVALGLFSGAIGCGLVLILSAPTVAVEFALLAAGLGASIFARDFTGIVEAWRQARLKAQARAVQQRLALMQDQIAARRAGLTKMIDRCEQAVSWSTEQPERARPRRNRRWFDPTRDRD